jgi:hypothetical protein
LVGGELWCGGAGVGKGDGDEEETRSASPSESHSEPKRTDHGEPRIHPPTGGYQTVIRSTHQSSREKRENLHPIMMHRPELLYVFLVLLRIPFSELDRVPRFEVGIPRSEPEEFELVW